MSGKGVVSFISNHSWISEPSFVVLRQHLMESFDKFWVENLHGNRKISEIRPRWPHKRNDLRHQRLHCRHPTRRCDIALGQNGKAA